MARQRTSEFHKRLQGEAYRTLKSPVCRKAIEAAAASFVSESEDKEAWESLCAIREHVNALIGAGQDLDAEKRKKIMAAVESGELKGEQALVALDAIGKHTFTVADYYAEVDRQGIPEY
jgi:hypothetical protein